jgi:hypothetical protein
MMREKLERGAFMQEKNKELIQKFEIYISSRDAQTDWLLYSHEIGNPAAGTHHLFSGIRFVSSPKDEGSLPVMKDPLSSNAYSVKSLALMKMIDDFVKKDLPGSLLAKTSWIKDRRR